MKFVFPSYCRRFRVLAWVAAGLLWASSPVLQAQVDRSKAPAAGPAPTIAIGDYHLEKLPNGLTLIVVENHRLPRVSWDLNLDLVPLKEGTKAGYVRFAGSLLGTGTDTRTKAQIDESIDFIGGQLRTSSQGIFASSLTRHTDALLEVMSDVLLHPTFSEAELEKFRTQALSGLASNATDPGAISSNLRARVLFGEDHPYGEVETQQSLKAIAREDLVGYHSTYFRPNVAYLVVVGDITPQLAREKALRYFGAWQPAEVPVNFVPMIGMQRGNQVCFADLPGAVQSNIAITHVVQLKPGEPDAIAVSVMNNILGGGGFSGRLMQNLRESKAYTYGARSSLSPDRTLGRFVATANVRNEVTDSAVVEFMAEIQRITREKVTASELQTTIQYMTGSFARSLEDPETVAAFALNIERNKLPKDYYKTYLQKLAAVTVEDIQRVAASYLRPEALFITVVGNRQEVADGLAQFAQNGRVQFFDALGRPVSGLEPAPEGMTAQSVVERHYEATGGIAKWRKVSGLHRSGKVEMGVPMQLQIAEWTLYGKGTRTEITFEGQVMMEEVITPTAGSTTAQGMKRATSAEDLADKQESLDPLFHLTAIANGKSYDLKGIDKQGERPMYVVEVRAAGSSEGSLPESTLYFDVATGELSRTTAVRVGPTGPLQSEESYASYQTFGGMRFPTLVTTVANSQALTITYDHLEVNPKLDASRVTLQSQKP
jgi:predicted Zn-dependent peptidase